MFQIRLFEPKDAKHYRSLRLESLKTYPECFDSKYQQQAELDKLFFEKLIESRSAKGKMVGAFARNTLIGICGVLFSADARQTAEIIQMYVKPDFQNKGVGKELLTCAKGLCLDRSIETLQLEVLKTNIGAAKFYEACGFRVDEALSQDLENVVLNAVVDGFHFSQNSN